MVYDGKASTRHFTLKLIDDMEDKYGYEMPRGMKAVSRKMTLYS